MTKLVKKKWYVWSHGAVVSLAVAALALAGWGTAADKGDINGDGFVDADDAVILMNYLAGNLPLLAGDLSDISPIVGVMIFAPAGTFTQGSPSDEPCRTASGTGMELQFNHTFTRNIAVMATEVTQQMWQDLRSAQPSLPQDPTDLSYGSGASRPVQNLTWHEAILFANLLSVEQAADRAYFTDSSFTVPVDSTNYSTYPLYCDFVSSGYRLPTEGEWEYLCRAGTTAPFSVAEPSYTAGYCSLCTAGLLRRLESVAVFCANVPSNWTLPAATLAPSPWNLYDMHGNVAEWCWDSHSSSYNYPVGEATDYSMNDPTNTLRVERGGSHGHDANNCRSAHRNFAAKGDRTYTRGFRLVRTLVPD